MAKKAQKKNKKTVHRLSEMQRTIQEGSQFVKAAQKIKNNRDVIQKGQKLIKANKPIRKIHEKKPVKPKYQRASKAEIKLGNRKIHKKGMRKQLGKKNKPRQPKQALKPIMPAIFPLYPPRPVPSSTKVMKTSSKNSMGKATKFKTSSRSDLQVPAFGFIDVCFCIDATGSMGSELGQAKQTVESIIHNIQNKVKTQGLQLRFAVVTYRDHPPQDSTYVTKINDFTDQFETINYLKTLNAWGGGDEPEAAHDGLFDSATKLNWVQLAGTPVLRYIFHIADAPPHGKQFGNNQTHEGCLCGMQTDDVIRQINKKQIHYRLIKARKNHKVDIMQEIFRKKIGDFDSTDIGHAKQLNVKVSDMIIHEILPDFA